MDSELKLQLLMLGLWLFMAYRMAKPLLNGIKSTSWKSQSATVTTSAFDRTGNEYTPKIIYKYTINNQEYMNDTYTFMGAGYIGKKKSINIAQQHPEGSLITIFVNPLNPEVSVIVPGVHWLQYASLLLITLFLVSVAYLGPIIEFMCPYVSWCRV